MKSKFRVSFSILAICLFCFMLGSLCAMKTKAEDSDSNIKSGETVTFDGGDGTSNSPYIITTKQQLNAVRDDLSANYKLNTDIVFTEEDFEEGGEFYNDGAGWQPIGGPDYTLAFKGVFDGNGFEIKGLYYNMSASHIGLFGFSSGTIKNLRLMSVTGTLREASSMGYTYIGGIVGYNRGRIIDCLVDGNLSVNADTNNSDLRFVGGITGYNAGTIDNCSFTGNITTEYYAAGGIAGNNEKTIENCFNNGDIEAEGQRVGGIVAVNKYNGTRAVVNTCYNVGRIKGNTAGGIAGDCSSGDISNCFNVGQITASSYGGGIIGAATINGNIINNCYNYGIIHSYVASAKLGGIIGEINEKTTIENAYSVGRIIALNGSGGGIVGYILSDFTGSLDNCYYLNNCDTGIGGYYDGMGGTIEADQENDPTIQCTFAEMQNENIFSGFDFQNVWVLDDSISFFPTLKTPTHQEPPSNTTDYAGGNGLISNPYHLSTKEHLDNVRKNLFSYYELDNDIVFDETDFEEGGEFYNDGAGWLPIGATDYSNPNNPDNIYQIAGFKGSFNGNGYAVKGLYISSSARFTGLFGVNQGIINNLGIENSEISNLCNENGVTGSITGVNTGHISGCYNTGSVFLQDGDVGGIAGISYGVIDSCVNKGIICTDGSRTIHAGGIVGGLNSDQSVVSNSYNTGIIKSVNTEKRKFPYLAGICSNNYGIVDSCYNIGSIVLPDQQGQKAGIANSGTITNSYYLDSSVQNTSQDEGDVSKKTLSEMKQIDAYTGFDFEQTWYISEEEGGYPFPQLLVVSLPHSFHLSDIMIDNLPTKLVYKEKEDLVLAGSTLKLLYETDSGTLSESISITEEMVSGFDSSEIGTQEIVVYYNGLSDSFTVDITHDVYFVEEVEATCLNNGQREHWVCNKCGKLFADEAGASELDEADIIIPQKDHSLTYFQLTEPTCTDIGNLEHWKCNDCGNCFLDENANIPINESEVVLLPYGHTLKYYKDVNPSCTEYGKTQYWECEICDKYFSDESGNNEIDEGSWVIAPLGHQMVHHAEIPATYDSAGNTEYWECWRCGKYFSDDAGDIEIAANSWVIPKKQFTYGWNQIGDNWYYYDSPGHRLMGWQKIANKWYYLDPNLEGARFYGLLPYKGNMYYLNAEGVMQTGWVFDWDSWFYFNSSGAMLTGWQFINNKWYYFDGSSIGEMCIGWISSGGKWYYLSSSGAMATGWVQDKGNWYYLNASGVMQTGWQKIGGKWYYLEPGSGEMLTGWQFIGDKPYCFSSGGAMVTGWFYSSDTDRWYYFDGSGNLVTGWQKINNIWYYFTSWGYMTANEWYNGYWFNANGSWTYNPRGSWRGNATGWWYGDTSGWYAKNCAMMIDGTRYFFDSSGYIYDPVLSDEVVSAIEGFDKFPMYIEQGIGCSPVFRGEDNSYIYCQVYAGGGWDGVKVAKEYPYTAIYMTQDENHKYLIYPGYMR